MVDATRFIYKITSNGVNKCVINAFSGANSYWFASILFKRFIKDNAEIVYNERSNTFGTRIENRVFDVTGDVTSSRDWIIWNDIVDEKKREIEKKLMF